MANDSDDEIIINIQLQERNDAGEENIYVVNAEVVNAILEDSILTAISSIREDRNRASFDNILKFVRRQGIKTDIIKLEQVAMGMVDCNKLVDKGKNGKESFYVVDDVAVKGKKNQENCDEEDTNDDENFIDEKYATAVNTKFSNMLSERVTQEVKTSNIN